MPRKAVDKRVRTLIRNGIKLRHRSLFVIVGDNAVFQAVNLHAILTKEHVGPRVAQSVLWCYTKTDSLPLPSYVSRALRRPQACARACA